MERTALANVHVPFEQATGATDSQACPPCAYSPMAMITAPLPRLGTERQPARPTIGPYVAAVGEQLGYAFHAWQSHLSDVSGETVPREHPRPGQSLRRLHSQYVGCMVSRQSGKTAWCAARVVAQLLMPNRPDVAAMFGLDRIVPQKVIYTAQSRVTAISKWLEHVDIIDGSKDLRKNIKRLTRRTGGEELIFVNGSTYRPVTPNHKGARGMSTDLVIVDEALAHPMWLLSALRPTMAQRHGATGCVGGQFVVISNAGTDDSELLNHMQELGIESLRDPHARRTWMEWSAPPDCDPLDERMWLETMPTLEQPNGIDLEFMREEAATMRMDDFMREYLCMRVAKSRATLIPKERWNELYRPDVMNPTSEFALGVDITPERSRGSIVAASLVDGYLPVEVLESREGIHWLVDAVSEIALKWNAPVAIDSGGPAGGLIPVLRSRDVIVIPLTTREVVNAAGCFYDAVLSKRITHMNDWVLNDAVTGCSKRAVGERWAFDRRGNVDISPLVAASFAVWLMETGENDRPMIYP